MTDEKLVHKAALLLIGAVLGAFGFSAYMSTSAGSPLSRGFWQSMKSSFERNSPTAMACIPQTEDGDIFFLTCGGIY
ncbi:hypothetical protein A3D71_00280 [Candidatus Kaiserbacteria bacterium RIFCSPHIGHO2_02_FULL_55_20]|uniref:Uncharacterized protein n=1 Tax=Candidatus Kaiserbacteria bacterium RIFCSPHIGHO2_02_FULL_55_20 TaxID=1798497 RepID=A0A1F6DVW2_9BACT|nr:MAG: hypothetical protein A2680_03200 [Candidatus Kaiserbacteria bacterium RIFCSPHIGHO2_01_FULL_55_37]OGG65523.1 MAG: hypothetical protein A3D71_00280 [Candidatus Kaiserbacteria bacterium RIFCSPHIGHO2_02_FULL_55_20]